MAIHNAASAASAASASSSPAAASSTSGAKGNAKVSFLSLPSETQREIISHCSQSDLICVALVSKHFHELASAQLYRNFHIIFPDEDDINFDSPIDGLAGGLDTFTTSNYNYAKHLKDIFMDTLSAGSKGEAAYQSYLYSASCGKFLNTLLYLTLKKAKSLEAFRWNIRVELSRPVYRELHRIASLKTLHIRMQAGESYYIPPPPLPVFVEPHAALTPSNHWPEMPPPMLTGPPGTTPPPIAGPPPPLGNSYRSHAKSRAGKRGIVAKDPSTLSGFKNLRSLAVLDIEDLDIVPELNTCIKNSSSTLTELQLSFSDSLAAQARKPPSDLDPDDSDADEEFQVVPVTQNTYDSSGPVKAFRAQEARKIQEAVLERIFDIDPDPTKRAEPPAGADGNRLKLEGSDTDKGETVKDPREEFVESLKSISSKLMLIKNLSNGSREFSRSQQDVLDTIEKAAKKYVEATHSIQKAEASSSSDAPGQSSSNDNDEAKTEPAADETQASGSASGDKENGQKTLTEEDENTEIWKARSHSHRRRRAGGDASPEDIDIAHLEVVEDAFDDFDDQQSDAAAKTPVQPLADKIVSDLGTAASGRSTPTSTLDEPVLSKEKDSDPLATLATLVNQGVSFEGLTTKLSLSRELAGTLGEVIESMRAQGMQVESTQIKAAETQLHIFNNYIGDIQNQIKAVEKEIEEVERKAASRRAETDDAEQSMKKYIRDTRGLPLSTLRIHLIPVKPSVLSRAINLSCLRQLTLLNAGNLMPIWSMLLRENETRPLALRSIHTDCVDIVFLTLTARLEELHELFLIERSFKHKPESFAPRCSTNIEMIRRMPLKKHIGTLKRLMIKDDTGGTAWDVDERTMILICTKGKQLKELAVSMNIHAVHAFMQYFSGLINLRAINILHFRNNDTCVWVVREILRFMVDNLSHHPELKLEWIAMEDERVDRVVRPSEAEAGDLEKDPKSKGASVAEGSGIFDEFSLPPLLPLEDLGSADEDNDSETETPDNGSRLRFKTVGPLQFYDVMGIKIFEKEIRSGCL